MEAEPKGKPVVLVTGSAGLIGSRVVADLARDHHVVGLDVKRPAELPPGTEFVACDLSRDDDTTRTLVEVRALVGPAIASVIHLAAYYDFSGKPSPLYGDLTVRGTVRLLSGLRAFDVEQFVFSSSHLVMKAAQPGERITEDSPVEPTWAYPNSKIEAEAAIREEHGDIPIVILRISGVYTDECQSIPIAQQIARIHQRELESHLFPGHTDRGQPFVHLDDLVACFRRVVERRAALGREELFLVAEPELLTYADLQRRIGELVHGTEWSTLRIPKSVAKAGAWVQGMLSGEETFIKPWMIDLADAHYPVDVTRARTLLGWEPRRRLHDCLGGMVAFLLRDPVGWYKRNKLPVPRGVARARRPAHA
ncbi:MAG: NAD(P)-dependent oxidoreductase [Pseudomonadota bacterium]|nr:NAD(P)-dependent oxidoreductase [Pseudomonadota bacterium]